MTFTTRKPSGRASFPTVLLAGVEGAGKTWAAVEATTVKDVDRAFFIEVGESQADAYGAVPGADYEIIEHDGTLGNIRSAIEWASQQPAAEGKYNLLIVDSITEIWGLLQDNAQHEANARARRKGRNVPEEGVKIPFDMWNQIKEKWRGIVNQLRSFPGPVLITARLDLVSTVDDKGNPTREKTWKIQAEKNLGFDVQVVVQARAPRQWTMTKIATTVEALQLPPGGEMNFKEFSLPQLFDTMGVKAGAPATTFVEPKLDGQFSEEAARAEEEARQAEERKAYVQKQSDGILNAEKRGDYAAVEAAKNYYASKGDGELVTIANTVMMRMQAAQMDAAVGAVQDVLEAEIVPDEPAA